MNTPGQRIAEKLRYKFLLHAFTPNSEVAEIADAEIAPLVEALREAKWGIVFNDSKQVWQIIAVDGRVLIDGIGEFRYPDSDSEQAAAKFLAEQIRDQHNYALALAGQEPEEEAKKLLGNETPAAQEKSEIRGLHTLEEVKKMSDEDLRVKVAELSGFVWSTKFNGFMDAGDIYYGSINELPDYPHDLNAVHEVENRCLDAFDDVAMDNEYEICLHEVCLAYYRGEARATARQRCEALVLLPVRSAVKARSVPKPPTGEGF